MWADILSLYLESTLNELLQFIVSVCFCKAASACVSLNTSMTPDQRLSTSTQTFSFLLCSRVGFYIGTFKSVTSLEAKFHREISLVRFSFTVSGPELSLDW